MPSQALRYLLLALLALSFLQFITACDQWALVINSGGVLSISIVSGGFGSQHRFRVRARQADGNTRFLEMPASGRLSWGSAGAGPVELTLLVPEACRVSEPNPRTVNVGEDETVHVAFAVDCSG